MKLKILASAWAVVFITMSCYPWEHPELNVEDFPLAVGAVHIYKLEGHSQGADSLVITTIRTKRHDDRTIYVDSLAYFRNDTLFMNWEEYFAMDDGYLFYYGTNAIGYLADPFPYIDFPLSEGKSWHADLEDTMSAEWECVSYDTIQLTQGLYRTFRVQSPNQSGGITSFWYAPDVGLVKLGHSDAGINWTQELVAHYPGGIPVQP